MNKTKITLLGVLLTGMTLTQSCVKQRDDMEGQGQNLSELLRIQEMHNKSCTITTKKADDSVLPQTNTFSTSIADPKIDNNDYKIKFLEIVDVAKTDCPYVSENKEELELRGEPGKTYNMIYRVDSKYLTLFKIVSEKDVSHYELPYSEKHNSHYYVPVGGFDISAFYNVEKQRNGDNRDTHVKMKVSVAPENYTQASHFAVNETKFNKFKAEEKKDTLPREYFEGEWYFNQTTVKASYNSRARVGDLGAADSQNQESNRVKFLLQKDALFAVNLNQDQRLSDDANLNMDEALSIPVKAVDYRRAREGTGLDFKEEKLEDLKPENTKYIEMDLVGTKTYQAGNSLLSMLFNASDSSQGKQLEEVEIGNDFISYLIRDGGDKLIRYSFKRVPENNTYQTKKIKRADKNHYGFFSSLLKRIFDHRTVREEDIDNRFLLNRFDPSKPIIYRFSRETPRGPENEWIRDIARESINLWQQAFEKASGEKRTFIKLVETCEEPHPEFGCDVPLGDIRYNTINFIDVAQAGIIGFGPSLADTLTGEIISATMNVTLFNIREGGYREIRSYISRNLGYQTSMLNHSADTQIAPSMTRLQTVLDLGLLKNQNNKFSPVEAYQWDAEGLVKKKSVIDMDFINQQRSTEDLPEITNFSSLAQLARGEQILRGNTISGHQSLSNTMVKGVGDRFGLFIQKRCPSVVKFINTYKNASSLPSTETENAAIEPCVKKYITAIGLPTTVHEIGHNLGLRHNFYGSFDKKNFAQDGDFKLKFLEDYQEFYRPSTSSIMDYQPTNAKSGMQFAPGWYDVAALRYGYFDKIELKNDKTGEGTIVTLPSNQTIDGYVSSKNASLHKYMYCTDEHRYYKVASNCDWFDEGTSHLEIAKNEIRKMHETFSEYALRYDRVGVNDLRYLTSLTKLRRIYEDWRMLVKNEVGDSKKYLQGVSRTGYETYVEKVINKHGRYGRDLLAARNLIVQFLVDMSFVPNKYCIVENGEYGEMLYELSIVRRTLQAEGFTGEIKSCKDTAVESFFSDKSLVVKKEIGHYLERGAFNVDPTRLYDSTDFSGTALFRANAHYFLLDRTIFFGGYPARQAGFHPSFLDEPDLRDALSALVINRLLNGTFYSSEAFDVDKYAVSTLLSPEDILNRYEQEGLFNNFKAESSLAKNLFDDFIDGLGVPGDLQESLRRRTAFMASKTDQPSKFENLADVMPVAQGVYLVTSTHGSFPYQAFDKIRRLRLMRSAAILTEETANKSIQSTSQQINTLTGERQPTLIDIFKTHASLMKYQETLAIGKELISAKQTSLYQSIMIKVGVSSHIKMNISETERLFGLVTSEDFDIDKLDSSLRDLLSQTLSDETLHSLHQATINFIGYAKKEVKYKSSELDAQENLLLQLML